MVRVLLLNPPRFLGIPWIREDFCSREAEYPTVYPNLSLASTAALLEQDGHKVIVIDANALDKSWEQTIKEIENAKPDFVGVWSTKFTLDWDLTFSAALDEDIPIVLSENMIANSWPKDLFELYPRVNVLILGETDTLYPDLARALESGGNLSNVKGIACKKGKEIRINPPKTPEMNVDSLPFPAYHLLPMHAYKGWFRKPFFDIITARGCPWKCSYCHFTIVKNKMLYKPFTVFRERSLNKVLEEIDVLINKYGRKEVKFQDLTFTANRKRIIELCKEMMQHGYDFQWRAQTRVDCIDGELCRTLKKAGCWCLELGLEFGTKEILEKSHKRINLEQSAAAVKGCKEAGIMIHAYTMWGYPGETETDVLETARLVAKCDADSINFNSVIALPDTPLFSECLEKGLLWAWDEYENKAEWAIKYFNRRKFEDKPVLKIFDEATYSRLRRETNRIGKRRISYLIHRLKMARNLKDLGHIARTGFSLLR